MALYFVLGIVFCILFGNIIAFYFVSYFVLYGYCICILFFIVLVLNFLLYGLLDHHWPLRRHWQQSMDRERLVQNGTKQRAFNSKHISLQRKRDIYIVMVLNTVIFEQRGHWCTLEMVLADVDIGVVVRVCGHWCIGVVVRVCKQ